MPQVVKMDEDTTYTSYIIVVVVVVIIVIIIVILIVTVVVISLQSDNILQYLQVCFAPLIVSELQAPVPPCASRTQHFQYDADRRAVSLRQLHPALYADIPLAARPRISKRNQAAYTTVRIQP